MTTTANGTGERVHTAESGGTPETAGGGIVRVNAFDGLFLRAEHLNLIEDYAQHLAWAVGSAGGPGVVYGYGVTRSGDKLSIAPGLAIDALGRALKSDHAITVPLPTGTPEANAFWWVEIVWTAWDFATEPVQGVPCDDPCNGRSTQQPYKSEGVLGRLMPDSAGALGGVAPSIRRRNWLASKLFDNERRQVPAWPYENQRGSWPASKEPLKGRSWQAPDSPRSPGEAVRLAVLLPDPAAGWQLDTWAARRDRGDPTPMRYWQTQAGMRPWDVFMAQILQFQDIVAPYLVSPGAVQVKAARQQSLEEIVQSITNAQRELDKQDRYDEAKAVLSQLRANVQTFGIDTAPVQSLADKSLPTLGIDELPPAGFLWIRSDIEDLAQELARILGDVADLRLCHGPVSDVGAFIQRAQHRDRIKLNVPRVPIDIFVPDPGPGNAGDWVAFARREMLECEVAETPDKVDEVRVYVIKEGDKNYDAWTDISDSPDTALPYPKEPDATLDFPERAWALPAGEQAGKLDKKLAEIDAAARLSAVAVVPEAHRKTLGLVRAFLIATSVHYTRPRWPEVQAIIGHDKSEAVVILAPKTNQDQKNGGQTPHLDVVLPEVTAGAEGAAEVGEAAEVDDAAKPTGGKMAAPVTKTRSAKKEATPTTGTTERTRAAKSATSESPGPKTTRRSTAKKAAAKKTGGGRTATKKAAASATGREN
jgi:hypothetical protein